MLPCDSPAAPTVQVRLCGGKYTAFCQTLLKLRKCCMWKPALNFLGFLIYIFPVGDGSETGTLKGATHGVTHITQHGCLKCSRRGKKIPQTNPNSLQSPLFPRPLNQSSIWLFYCSLLGANLSACVFLKEFASCWAFVLHKCKKQFCPELLPGSSLTCGTAGSNCLQQGGCYRADTPEHCHVFITHFHLRDPAEPISVLKFWNQGETGPQYL